MGVGSLVRLFSDCLIVMKAEWFDGPEILRDKLRFLASKIYYKINPTILKIIAQSFFAESPAKPPR